MELRSEDLLQIRQEYEKQIVLPTADKIPVKQFFLCPVGLVGAGKSTVVKALSEMLSLVRISSDEVRKFLKEEPHRYEQLMEIIRPLAKKLAEQGYSLTFEIWGQSPYEIWGQSPYLSVLRPSRAGEMGTVTIFICSSTLSGDHYFSVLNEACAYRPLY